MAPFHATVVFDGLLQVWSTEWEVSWSGNTPRRKDGYRDRRYQLNSTTYSATQVAQIAQALESAWSEAERLVASSQPGDGQLPGCVPGARIEVARRWGQPALIIENVCVLTSREATAQAAADFRALVRFAEERFAEVKQQFGV